MLSNGVRYLLIIIIPGYVIKRIFIINISIYYQFKIDKHSSLILKLIFE